MKQNPPTHTLGVLTDFVHGDKSPSGQKQRDCGLTLGPPNESFAGDFTGNIYLASLPKQIIGALLRARATCSWKAVVLVISGMLKQAN